MYIKAFSLIELMVVIAIIAVISAVGIPAYKNYVIRAKVIDRMNILYAFKDEVVNTYQRTGSWPASVNFGGNVIPARFTTVVNGVKTADPAGPAVVVSNLPNIQSIYYSVFLPTTADPTGRLRISAQFNGLEGAEGYVAPVGASDGGYSGVRITVYEHNGALKTVCGSYDPGFPDTDVHVNYRPAGCRCNNVGGIAYSTALPVDGQAPFSGGSISGCM